MSVADQLRQFNIRTVYVHVHTAEVRSELPDDLTPEQRQLWLPFQIRRVNQEALKRDGLFLAYAGHELEAHAQTQLHAAQEAEKKYSGDQTAKEQQLRRQPMPQAHLDDVQIGQAYLLDRANTMVLLLDGMVEPPYTEVKDSIRFYEKALMRAIINFSGEFGDPKAVSGTSAP